MSMKKFLFPALLFGSGLALIYRHSARAYAKHAQAKLDSEHDSYDAIDAYIEGQMRRLHITGASFAVVEGERIVHVRGFGHARPGGEVPTPQTPFFIGSPPHKITPPGGRARVRGG